MHRSKIGLLVSASFAFSLLAVVGYPAAPAHAGASGLPFRLSRSLGLPERGLLVGGAELDESALVHHPDDDRTRGWFWGTVELVTLVQRAAAAVATIDPGGGRLQVGELSRRGGGRVPGHLSHENGRDVDIGFYITDADGHPIEANTFVKVRASGRGLCDGKEIRFDDERNWHLIEALLRETEAPVQYIFTSPTVRRRVLRAGERLGAPPALLDRAARVILPPIGSHNPHRNHFHVRIYCDPSDVPGCRDRGMVWPWVPEASLRGPGAARASL